MRNYAVPILLTLSCAGCGGLSTQQAASMESMKRDGVAVKEKSPGGAMMLGFLPGCGSWYTGQIGWGALDTLTWPWSIFWDPLNGWQGANVINYDASLENVKRRKREAVATLDAKGLTGADYLIELRKIEVKYDY